MTAQSGTTFKFSVKVPQRIRLTEDPNRSLEREEFYHWIWNRFENQGLLGIHEGTLLSEDAAQQGFETDSWTVDSGEAPRERDWVGRQKEIQAELYFSGKAQAERAIAVLKDIPDLQIESVEEQKSEDWGAEWKASFLNSGQGVLIPPFWRVVPPWFSEQVPERILRINPGAGFGTGTHETTQLCLEAMGDLSQRISLRDESALDFGSGSGILSVALALLGAQVDAVEIDPLAIDNAIENARLNEVTPQITFSQSLQEKVIPHRVVVANILKPVLLEFAEKLVQRIHPEGALILSGLIERDVNPVVEKYSQLLQMPVTRVMEQGEWRALFFDLTRRSK